MSLPLDFGRNVRAFRISRNMRQLTVAKRMGVDASVISMIESGRRKPSLDTLVKLADALGSSIDDLLGRKDVDKGCLCREIATAEDFDLVSRFIKMLSA